MKTLKSAEVYLKEYETFDETYNNIKAVYNKKWLHSSIGYVPLCEFEAEILNTNVR